MTKKICLISLLLICIAVVLYFKSFSTNQYPSQRAINNTITIKDFFNRKIQVSTQIKRIIPVYYGECEIITAIGARDKIIGVGFLPQKSVPPYSFILEKFFPQIYSLPLIGDGSINFEKLIELKPDIVLIDQRVNILHQMEKFNIVSLALFPKKLDDIIHEIAIIGKITNKEHNANILINYLNVLLDNIKRKCVLLSKNKIPKTYYIWNDIFTTVNDSVHNEILEICGSTNVLKNEFPNAYSLTVSLENLYKWNPDFIIIRDRSNLTVSDILTDKRLKQLKAVRNKLVFKEHMGWRGYKIETFFGMIEKSKWFHPELFSETMVDLEYQNFLKLIESFY